MKNIYVHPLCTVNCICKTRSFTQTQKSMELKYVPSPLKKFTPKQGPEEASSSSKKKIQ